MDDLISRQAAIDGVHDAWMKGAYYTETINALKQLPSAQKKGKWIGEPDHIPHCSVCKVENYYAYKYDSDSGLFVQQDFFCPNCGADMRG